MTKIEEKRALFSKICPLKQVENDILISHKGDLSIIYQLSLPDVMSLTEDDYNAVQAAFSSSINMLPPNYQLQRLDFVYHLPSQIEQQNKESYLEYHNLKLLNAKYATRTETYFIITLAQENTKTTYKKGWFEIFNTTLAKSHLIDRSRTNELTQKADNLIRQITDVLSHRRISATRLNNEQINHLVIHKYFSLSFYKTPEPINCFTDYADLKDSATVGSNIIKVFSLLKDGLPEKISNIKTEGNYYKKGISELPVSYLHDLSFNLQFPHIVNQVIYSIDNTDLYAKLKRKRNLMNGMSWANSLNSRNGNNIQQIIESKEGSGDKLVEHHLSVTVIGPEQDRQLLNHFSNQMTNYFEQSGMKYSENSYNTLRYFFSAAPGSATDIPSEHKSYLFSNQVACFQVWEEGLRSSNQGVLFVDRKTEKPIRVDLWNHPLITNRNKIIIGASGTGKSFLTNKLISDFLDMGDDVFVTDMGASYETTIKIYNGEYIEFTPSQPLILNPFLLSGKTSQGYYNEPDSETIDFITMLLFTAWQSANKGSITSEINAVLKILISGFYKHINEHNIFPDYDQFYKYSIIELETNEQINSLTFSTFNKESFKLVMRGFLSTDALGSASAYGDIFNGRENSNLVDSSFVVFELKHIKGDPVRFPLAFFIIIYIISQKISAETQQRRNKKVHFFMDEVWSVLKGEYGDAKAFIEFAFRAFRKEGGCISIISQSLSDIFSNPEVGDSIKANCDIKIFKYLDQAESNIVDKHLELSDFNKNILYSLKDKYRDICVFFKDQACVYKLEVDKYTEGAYTTSPEERRWRSDELINQNGNIHRTLTNYSDIKNGKIPDDRKIKLKKQ